MDLLVESAGSEGMGGGKEEESRAPCLFDAPRAVCGALAGQAEPIQAQDHPGLFIFLGVQLALTPVHILTQHIPTGFLRGRV